MTPSALRRILKEPPTSGLPDVPSGGAHFSSLDSQALAKGDFETLTMEQALI